MFVLVQGAKRYHGSMITFYDLITITPSANVRPVLHIAGVLLEYRFPRR